MRRTIEIEVELLERVRDALVKQASERDALKAQLGDLQKDLDVHQGVISLVQDGLVDPADISVKVAEYREDPDRIMLVKHAAALGLGSADLGALDHTDSSDSASGETAEGRLVARLRTALNPD